MSALNKKGGKKYTSKIFSHFIEVRSYNCINVMALHSTKYYHLCLTDISHTFL